MNNYLNQEPVQASDSENGVFTPPVEVKLSRSYNQKCAHCGRPVQADTATRYAWTDRRRTSASGYVVNCSHCGNRICIPDSYIAVSNVEDSEKNTGQNHGPKRVLVILLVVLSLVMVGLIIALVWSMGSGNRTKPDVYPADASVSGDESVGDESTEEPADASDEEPMEVPTKEEVVAPEIPDVIGYTYESAEEDLLALNVPIETTYAYNSDGINRGCISDITWNGESLCVTLSLGRENTFYEMHKVTSDGTTEYTDVYYVDETTGLHTIAYKYDTYGNETYQFTFVYDDDLKEVEQDFYLPDGTYHHKWQFEYNEQGQILVEHKYDSTGYETDQYAYEYDDEGRMTRRYEYKNGSLVYTWVMQEYDTSVPNFAYSAHMFGNWTYAAIYDSDGKYVRYGIQKFDSNGSIESFGVYGTSGATVYRYEFSSADVAEINVCSDDMGF